MVKCPFCQVECVDDAELRSHVQTFHPDVVEEQRKAFIRQHPEAYLREMGFAKELNRVKQGLCPSCGSQVITEDLPAGRAWRVWQQTGVCGPCQTKLGV